MAEQAGDKTEKPTPQRLRKAREQGQVVRSRDMATAVGILVSFKLIILLMPMYLDDFRTLFWECFPAVDSSGTLDNLGTNLFTDALLLTLKMIVPLAVVPLAVVISGLFPGGWVINFSHLMPKLERFDPVSNMMRLASPKHVSDLAVSIIKAVALGAMLVYVSRAMLVDYLALQGQSLDQALIRGADLMTNALMALCMVFVLFAFIDLPLQILFYLRGLRMTKQEIKEEHKSSEGRPEVRQRIRQLQMQMARRSVKKAVPSADVVIVNPEHYAVALKYDEKRAEAPFLVAKGIDEMALYIRRLAQENKVEVVALPPLARAIYNTSQINQQIPAVLYKAVAQVLSYVMQLKAFQSGRRNAQPRLPVDLSIPQNLTQ
jgi:flagellar biosynthetic protein FlhB